MTSLDIFCGGRQNRKLQSVEYSKSSIWVCSCEHMCMCVSLHVEARVRALVVSPRTICVTLRQSLTGPEST